MDDATKHRLLAAGALVNAVAHVLTPRAVIAPVEWWYTEGLQAEFEPTEATVRRVRLLAVPSLVVALYYWLRAADST